MGRTRHAFSIPTAIPLGIIGLPVGRFPRHLISRKESQGGGLFPNPHASSNPKPFTTRDKRRPGARESIWWLVGSPGNTAVCVPSTVRAGGHRTPGLVQLAIFIDQRDRLPADQRFYRHRAGLLAQLDAGQLPRSRFEMRPDTHPRRQQSRQQRRPQIDPCLAPTNSQRRSRLASKLT